MLNCNVPRISYNCLPLGAEAEVHELFCSPLRLTLDIEIEVAGDRILSRLDRIVRWQNGR